MINMTNPKTNRSFHLNPEELEQRIVPGAAPVDVPQNVLMPSIVQQSSLEGNDRNDVIDMRGRKVTGDISVLFSDDSSMSQRSRLNVIARRPQPSLLCGKIPLNCALKAANGLMSYDELMLTVPLEDREYLQALKKWTGGSLTAQDLIDIYRS